MLCSGSLAGSGQRTTSCLIVHGTCSPCRASNGACSVRPALRRGEVGLAIAQKVLARPELAALELFSFRAYGSRKRLVIRLDKACGRNLHPPTLLTFADCALCSPVYTPEAGP
jgi:hypothetical protein